MLSRRTLPIGIQNLREIFPRADLLAKVPLLRALFAGIPRDCCRNNPMMGFEGFYVSVFYSRFAALWAMRTSTSAEVCGYVEYCGVRIGYD